MLINIQIKQYLTMKTFFLISLFLSFLSISSTENILEKGKTITVDGFETNFIIFNSEDFQKNSKIYFKFTSITKCTHEYLLFQFEDDISFQKSSLKSCNSYNIAETENNGKNWSTDKETIYSITKDNNREFLVLCFECPDWVTIQNLPDYEKDVKEAAKFATELASGLSKIVIIWIVVAASFFVIITTSIICCCCGCCACCGCTGCKKQQVTPVMAITNGQSYNQQIPQGSAFPNNYNYRNNNMLEGNIGLYSTKSNNEVIVAKSKKNRKRHNKK